MISLGNILIIFNVVSFVLGRHTVKVIGGGDADIRDFPYMAGLSEAGIHDVGCGGSIINENTVLLAAHCVFDADALKQKIIYGNTNYHKSSVTNGVKIFVHENYINGPPYQDDIAILKVDPPIVFSETAQPIKLPPKNTPNPEGKEANISGWGVESGHPLYPAILQTVNLTIIGNELCENIMKDTDLPLDSEKQICAHADMSDGIPRGICHGDSGGPLVTDGVQYGIVSYNYGDCGSVEYPDVFTRVAHYIDWIEDKL